MGPGELLSALIDEEGAPITAAALWNSFRGSAPAHVPGPALDCFAAAVSAAERAAAIDDVEGVLALEAAFDVLAQIVKGAKPAGPSGH